MVFAISFTYEGAFLQWLGTLINTLQSLLWFIYMIFVKVWVWCNSLVCNFFPICLLFICIRSDAGDPSHGYHRGYIQWVILLQWKTYLSSVTRNISTYRLFEGCCSNIRPGEMTPDVWQMLLTFTQDWYYFSRWLPYCQRRKNTYSWLKKLLYLSPSNFLYSPHSWT